MRTVADTYSLVSDGVITPDQAAEIERRARETMVALAVNAVLTFGILSATGGLIVVLASALAVAVAGLLALATGIVVLRGAGPLYAMFGNAAALIGAGMLMGGLSFELLDKYEDVAGLVMFPVGALVAAVAARRLMRGGQTARFVAGSILLMGLAMHLGGVGLELEHRGLAGLAKALFMGYAAGLIVLAGWVTDVRLVTALAIVPLAQMLDSGTGYFHAVYAFYSPEPTLSILQMAVVIAVCLWVAGRFASRVARHAGMLAILAFVVANLCALVGSLWGDTVGEYLWGPRWFDSGAYDSWEAYQAAGEAFRARSLTISEHVYSVAWALVLVAMMFWAAHRHRRGLFNGAMTFAAIHAYTQMFESFGDQALAYVIGGLAAIPLAWGMWRLNGWLQARDAAAIAGGDGQ